jgi:hypothetical protein
MSQLDIFLTLRMTWILTPVGFPESMQFSAHTGQRDDGDINDLIDQMDTFAGSLSGVLAPATYNRYVLSNWQSGPGFTGWHQRYAADVAISTGGGDMLPHQLSVVIGYRNITEPSIALGRRRNRINVGPLRSSTMDTSGRTTTTINSTLSDDISNFHDGLQTVPTDIAVAAEFAGLVVVSPTEGVGTPAEQATIGRRYDILRSRAEKTPETPTLRTLEFV